MAGIKIQSKTEKITDNNNFLFNPFLKAIAIHPDLEPKLIMALFMAISNKSTAVMATATAILKIPKTVGPA